MSSLTNITLIGLLILFSSSAAFGRQCTEMQELFDDINTVRSLDLRSEQKTQIKEIPNSISSLMGKVMAIRQAKESVDITSYIFRSDDAGLLLVNELASAVGRGVKVRVLIDAVGSFEGRTHYLHRLYEKQLYEGQVQISVLNPIFVPEAIIARTWGIIAQLSRGKIINPTAVNNRIHDKILLVDARLESGIAFVGSRNIGNEYSGLQKRHNFEDFEVMVRSSPDSNVNALWTMKQYYDYVTANSSIKPLTRTFLNEFMDRWFPRKPPREESDTLAMEKWMQKTLEELSQRDFLNTNFVEAFSRFATDARNVIVRNRLSFMLGRQNSFSSLHMSIKRELARATKKVEIVSPYLILYPRDIKLFKEWLEQNPNAELHIYSGTIKTNDSSIVQTYFDNVVAKQLLKLESEPLFRGRIKLHAYNIDGMILHTKMIAIDSQKVLVTSSNFDPRSRYSNSEIGIWINSPEFYGRAENNLKYLRENSLEFNSPEWIRQRDQVLESNPMVRVQYSIGAIISDRLAFLL